MQLDFLKFLFDRRPLRDEVVTIGLRAVPVRFRRNRRARRYILRVKPDGCVQVTIPRGGSKREAQVFVQQHTDWIVRQIDQQARHREKPQPWGHGTTFLFRGELVILQVQDQPTGPTAHFADQTVALNGRDDDLRRVVEKHLQHLAMAELGRRTMELAQLHQAPLRRVSIRSQRTRWGSCSARGTVSLNWRLIQMPPLVRDYLILHELMHFREMNHSHRFWRLVEQVCPEYAEAERWLKQHQHSLRP